ncbi:uncharacterized protein DMENIID0001_122240 [Sergentomyia squamirostris]
MRVFLILFVGILVETSSISSIVPSSRSLLQQRASLIYYSDISGENHRKPRDSECPPHRYTTSKNVTVMWTGELKGSSILMKSDPMCLTKDKLPVYRECTRSGVIPPDPPDCAYTQPLLEHMSSCPETFVEIKGRKNKDDLLCVLVTEPKKWETDCLNWGIHDSILDLSQDDFQAVREYVQRQPGDKFWLPLRSYGQYLPFQIHLPGGKRYNAVFKEDDYKRFRLYGERHPGGNCLSLSKGFRNIHIEDCNSNHSTVCIYNAKKPYLNLACPEKSFTTRYKDQQTECITFLTKTDFKVCDRYFLANTKDKLVLFRQVLNEFRDGIDTSMSISSSDRTNLLMNCAVSFFDANATTTMWDITFWTKNKDSLSSVFWSPDMHSKKLEISYDRHMILDEQGHWDLDIILDYSITGSCAVCTVELAMYPPTLTLVFNPEHESLELTIYSSEFLWHQDDDDSGVTCFTDAEEKLLSNVKIKDLVWRDKIKVTDIISQNNNWDREYITKSIYELDISSDTPGHYWCEGLVIPNFTVIQSNRVIAYTDEDITSFSFRTITDCRRCQSDFTDKRLKQLVEDFKDTLENYDKKMKGIIDDVKLMKIVQSSENSTEVEMIFHAAIEVDDVGDMKKKCPDDFPEDVCAYYRIGGYLHGVVQWMSRDQQRFRNLTVTHVTHCLPYETDDNGIQWISARIGERRTLRRLCLTTNLLPVYRMCSGNFILGAHWNEDYIPKCQEDDIPEFTKRLFELDNSEVTSVEIIDQMHEVTTIESKKIIPADLYLMSSLTTKVATSNTSKVEFDEIEKVINIYSHTMQVNETTARASQILNATNILLDMNERIITNTLLDALSDDSLTDQEDRKTLGVISVKGRNLMSYVIDPSIANVSGIALYRTSEDANDLSDIKVKYLFANQSTEDLLESENDLETAVFVPQDLLRRIDEINQTVSVNVTLPPRPELRIVITVIANDRLFQDNHIVTMYKPSGRIVSITIPGYGPNLPTFLPIVFKQTQEVLNGTQVCGFWDFSPADKKIYSEWSTTGCEFLSRSLVDDQLVLCGCSHLTNFAFLLMGEYKNDLPPEEYLIRERHKLALDIITVLGCSLSLAGIVGIWITAIFFKSWRDKAGSKVILQLSIAIALQMLLFLFLNAEYLINDITRQEKKIMCITLGALLQYSVLVVFSWMLIVAYLQYLRYVVVFGNPRPTYFTIKSVIIGWILPTIPVILALGLDMDSYLPVNLDTGNLQGVICYPKGNTLYFAILLPVGVILLANCGVYIAVIYSITRKMDQSSKKNDTKIHLAQLRLSFLLFFLLGMSWIFGFLVLTEKHGNLLFSYLFCLTATLQGFVLFAYFIVMDPMTRKLWEQFFRSLTCGKPNKSI